MNKKKNNMLKAVVAFAVALAFVLPGAAAFANNEKLGEPDHDVGVNSIDSPVSGLDGTALGSNSWIEVLYSGTGHWEQMDYASVTEYHGCPPGSGDYFAQANQVFNYEYIHYVWDVGLFTPSLDLSGSGNSVDLDFEVEYYCVNYEVAMVKTYSGGTAPENFVEILWSKTLTYSYYGLGEHVTCTFDPSGYDFPNDVYIEFYYTSGGYPTTIYNSIFAIDDVTIAEIGFFEGFEGDTFPPGPPEPEFIVVTNLSYRWNMVSIPFNHSVNKADLYVEHGGTNYAWADAVSGGIVANAFFGWDRTNQLYALSDVLEPGCGYWLWAYNDCILKVLA